MSPLWPESIRLHIGPDCLRLTRAGGTASELPLAADWAVGLATLPVLPRRARLHVTVADRHARYLRIDWPAGLRAAERAAFTRHRFQTVFGIGEDWCVLADRNAVVLPSLACALPRALLEAVQDFARTRHLRLVRLEGAFAAEFNRHGRRFIGDGAFARAEAGRVTVALWRDGVWAAVRSQAVAVADAAAAAGCLAGLLPGLAVAGQAMAQGTLYIAGAAATATALPAGWTLAGVEGGAS